MSQLLADVTNDLKKADLRYVSDKQPGITRQRSGQRFKYFDTDDKVITSDHILKRINALAIPPAWHEVWICPSPSGYLQATGLDDRHRKQYIYHDSWVKICQENKFDKMIHFGKVLPQIRKKVGSDIHQSRLGRDKVLAAVIWLLDHTLIRVGNDEYAKDNQSYGLTTLRHRHVTLRGENIKFEFVGKSGIGHCVKISHPTIARIVKKCVELPGYEIFQYIDQEDQRHTVDSADVNSYLKIITGEDITAKDFRTWGGTVVAASTLYTLGDFDNEEAAKHNITQAVKKVSQHLRNTPTVCRNYYIHPKVTETYQKEILIPHFKQIFARDKKKAKLSLSEYAVVTLLDKY